MIELVVIVDSCGTFGLRVWVERPVQLIGTILHEISRIKPNEVDLRSSGLSKHAFSHHSVPLPVHITCSPNLVLDVLAPTLPL